MKRSLPLFAVIFLSCFSISPLALADTGCPKIESLIDFNCDKNLKIVFTGDSIVTGLKDTKNPIQGYPGRVQTALPGAEVINLGFSGITSSGLLANLKQAFKNQPNGATATALHNADLIVVTVGVNDFFAGTEPGHTLRNIANIVKFLKSTLKNSDGTAPIVAVGSLIFTLRAFQQPFIRQLDNLLIQYNSSTNLPVLFRFDKVDVREHPRLSSDRLHPNGSGYDAMAKASLKAIKKKVQSLMAAQRTDNDADGVYDELEPKFGTDSTKADTDGDTRSDGQEIFQDNTDPTVAD